MTEIVKIGKESFGFKFDFEALREMDDERGHNCFIDAARLAEGESLPLLVSEVLEVSIKSVKGKKIAHDQARDAALRFIDLAGFQTSHTLAQKLLAYVLIGDEKKSGLRSFEQVIAELRKSYLVSPLTTFTSRLSVWGFRIATFGVLVWLTFSEYGLPSLLKMD